MQRAPFARQVIRCVQRNRKAGRFDCVCRVVSGVRHLLRRGRVKCLLPEHFLRSCGGIVQSHMRQMIQAPHCDYNAPHQWSGPVPIRPLTPSQRRRLSTVGSAPDL